MNGETLVRPVARIPLPEHRLYRSSGAGAVPLDGEASYSIRLSARLEGRGTPFLRLDLRRFDDGTQTEVALPRPMIDLEIDLDSDGKWHDLQIDLPAEVFYQDGVRANVVMVYVRFGPPAEGYSTLALDDLELVEWRHAAQMPDHFGAFDYFRNVGTSRTTVEVEVMPLRD